MLTGASSDYKTFFFFLVLFLFLYDLGDEDIRPDESLGFPTILNMSFLSSTIWMFPSDYLTLLGGDFEGELDAFPPTNFGKASELFSSRCLQCSWMLWLQPLLPEWSRSVVPCYTAIFFCLIYRNFSLSRLSFFCYARDWAFLYSSDSVFFWEVLVGIVVT